MVDYAFLSYARTDASDYAAQLEQHLEANGIVTWYDREIPAGTNWEAWLREKIGGCAAFILVMTPEAERSDEVQAEFNLAKHKDRPIRALLLDGEPHWRLTPYQWEDVRNSSMPSDSFIEGLRFTVNGPEDREGDGGGDGGTNSLALPNEEAFRVLKHIYSRATSGATTFRILEVLRQTEGLGTTVAIGKSKRTRDGQSDYVMVRAAGKRLLGTAVYVRPSNGVLTFRLRPEDVLDLPSEKITVRETRPDEEYAVSCSLLDDVALEIAVELTRRALARIRSYDRTTA